MPNLEETRRDIESYIDSNVSGIIPIAYDNVEFDNSVVQDYAHLTLVYNDSQNVNINAINNRRIRHLGTIVFKIYNKIGVGTSSAFTLIDSIKTQVENKYISSNLVTYAANPVRKGAGKIGYYTYFLRIPFVSDEC